MSSYNLENKGVTGEKAMVSCLVVSVVAVQSSVYGDMFRSKDYFIGHPLNNVDEHHHRS